MVALSWVLTPNFACVSPQATPVPAKPQSLFLCSFSLPCPLWQFHSLPRLGFSCHLEWGPRTTLPMPSHPRSFQYFLPSLEEWTLLQRACPQGRFSSFQLSRPTGFFDFCQPYSVPGILPTGDWLEDLFCVCSVVSDSLQPCEFYPPGSSVQEIL